MKPITTAESDHQPAATLPRNVRLLGWASFWNDVASEMVYPLIPQFLMVVLRGNHTHLGIIEGVGESIASLVKLASGTWSDRSAVRKPFVVLGYGTASLARPLIALAAAPWHLFLARIVDRIGKGIRTAPRDAMIADSTPDHSRGRAFGFHRAMDHAGAAIGPVVATVFLWWRPDDLRWLFALTLIPGIAVVALVVSGLREPPRVQRAHDDSQLGIFLPQGGFRVFLFALVVFTLGNSSDQFLLARASEIGVATIFLPSLWFVFHVAKSLGNLAGGRLVDRHGPMLPLSVGWLVYASVYLTFAWATQPWQVWAAFLVYALYYSLTEPAEKTLVTRLVNSEHQGLAFGWYNFAIGIFALPANVIFGWLYDRYGAIASFSWGASLALLAVVLLAATRPETRPQH